MGNLKLRQMCFLKNITAFLVLQFLLNFASFGQQPFNFISTPNVTETNSGSGQLNQFTGKFGYSIPLYSYSSPSSTLKFFVSLDYSSGGLKINDDPSSIGTGWNLNAGGMITRQINGLPDDLNRTTPGGYNVSGFAYTPNIPNPICGFQYKSVGYYDNKDSKVGQDSEPDEFFFNFLGISGAFNIPRGGLYVNGPKVVTKPQSNLNFSFFIGNSWPIKSEIREIIVSDDNGIEYTFSAKNTTGRSKANFVQNPTNPTYPDVPNLHYEYERIWEDYVTAWSLTKVKDKNSGEEILLEYETFYPKTKQPIKTTSYSKISSAPYTVQNHLDDRNYEYWGVAVRLSKITITNGDKITFQYDVNNRCDLENNKALKAIKVENNTGAKIDYNLDHVYYEGNNEIAYNACSSSSEAQRLSKWLFLKSVKKVLPSSSALIASFDYVRSSDKISAIDNTFPKRKLLNDHNIIGLYNHDLWGFYKGEPSKPCTTCYCPFGECNSPAKLGYPEIGSLKKITLPSGGSTNIEYEGNKIYKNGSDQLTYGIRVKKITQSDGINSSNDIVKEYKYIKEDGTSSAFENILPPFSYNNEMKSGSTIHTYLIRESFGVNPPTPIQGSPVGYSRVEEVSSTGSIISDYTSFAETAPLSTTYTYPFAVGKPRNADWAYGLLKKVTVKDKLGSIVRTTENTFNVVVNSLTLPEFKSMRTAFKRESQGSIFEQTYDPVGCAEVDSYFQFSYDSYYPVTGRSELISATEKNFLKDGSIINNKIDYEYDPTNYYLRKTISYNSLNDKLEKILFYPSDYSTNSLTYKLVQKDIKSIPVSSISILTKENGDKFISGFEKTDFKQLSDFSVRADKTFSLKSKNLISIPSNKTTFTPEENYGEATSKLTEDIRFEKYDAKGNLLNVVQNYTNQSAIWDSETKVVTAKANALFEDIAYSSFETSEKGNWNYSGVGSYELNAPTGKKVLILTTATPITKSSISPSKVYQVSYWSNNGPYTVNGNSTPTVTGELYDGWRYYSHNISNASTLSISGTGMIDELRLYPEKSRMTTITYEPLVGMTSEAEIDGQIKKYSYDSYGRLVSIKDEKGNLVKLICYNSQGAPSACGEGFVFRNFSWAPFVLYNQNCPAGTSSAAFNYTVPIGRYISFISQEDAEDQALKDALTYGQAIANRTTSLCAPTTVYAKLTYENVSYVGSTIIGDVVVRFYSDQACQVPLSVNNLQIFYSQMDSGFYSEHSTYATGTQIILESGRYLAFDSYVCDDYGTFCYWETFNDDVYLMENTNYVIVY